MGINRTITVGLVILIIQLWLLVSAGLFFQNVQQTQTIMLIYTVMLLFTIVVQLTKSGKEETESMFAAGINKVVFFFIGFAATAIFLIILFIPTLFASVGEPLTLMGTQIALYVGIVYAFTKAFVEEALFRDMLLNRIGNFGQAVLFGMFHFAALSAGGASLSSVLLGAFFLGVLGFVWGYLKRFGGILFTTGSHTAWNMHALGILKSLIGG